MSGFGQGVDGYYDDSGHWQRTKFCFVSCGDRCTCMPPIGGFYSEAHDKKIKKEESANTSVGE